MADNSDRKYMQMALDLAEKGRGKVSPNPLVGAVVVKGKKIIGKGYHKKVGTPHAEINALKDAGDKARGASLYVTLEPCCHVGRTGPCTDAVIEAGIKEVIYALRDPNPVVRGKGAYQLRKAGIKVRSGILRTKAEELNEIYLKNVNEGRPFVILKLAMTLDGRIATPEGDSKWITGEKSRMMVHKLRSNYDAVAIGARTVIKDDPRLTVRNVKGLDPYRIIICQKANFGKTINLIKNNKDAKTIVATTAQSAKDIRAKNLTVWSLKKGNGGVSLSDFLEKAINFGITSILVEGGSRLATSFIKEDLVDKYYLFMAPKIVGSGIEAIGDLNIRKIADAINFENFEYSTEYKPDLLFVGYRKG